MCVHAHVRAVVIVFVRRRIIGCGCGCGCGGGCVALEVGEFVRDARCVSMVVRVRVARVLV